MTPSGSSDDEPDNPAVVNGSSINYSHEPGRQFRQTVNSLNSADSVNKEDRNGDEVTYVSFSI